MRQGGRRVRLHDGFKSVFKFLVAPLDRSASRKYETSIFLLCFVCARQTQKIPAACNPLKPRNVATAYPSRRVPVAARFHFLFPSAAAFHTRQTRLRFLFVRPRVRAGSSGFVEHARTPICSVLLLCTRNRAINGVNCENSYCEHTTRRDVLSLSSFRSFSTTPPTTDSLQVLSAIARRPPDVF